MVLAAGEAMIGSAVTSSAPDAGVALRIALDQTSRVLDRCRVIVERVEVVRRCTEDDDGTRVVREPGGEAQRRRDDRAMPVSPRPGRQRRGRGCRGLSLCP